jgi:hypothetical protein
MAPRNVDEGGGSEQQERKLKIQQYLEKGGWKNALITALYHDKKVIGCLEILTKEDTFIDPRILLRLEHVRDVLQTALQQYRQLVQNKISALVKEHFTAVQSSVEWKFNNAAIRYLLQQHQGQAARMMPVVFDHVYPLYGAIDIKNSSGERNRAIQQDLLQQLQWVKTMLEPVQQQLHDPLLQEVLARTTGYIASVANFLFAADEQAIQHFLRTQVAELLQYIANALPDFRPSVATYFQKTDNPLQVLNENRQKFEDSVTQINNSITQYLDQEQEQIQQVYPHYFERFVTDGVEFNLYVGQSIVPGRKFHPVHLKNLRLWQLQALATAAREVQRLSARLHLPLQTTQLVLAYAEPLAIRFRNAERKFDVDGVQHSRYEVVKKRIDKALVKGTNERITQPGAITIVYSGEEEAREYLQYIDYLKTQGLVTGAVEDLAVEELQSVSGLKALRVPIQLEQLPPMADEAKRAKTVNKPVL